MNNTTIFRMTPRQFFITSLWLGLAFKLLLAVLLPLTTDEAYFLIWARHLDYGFYDHPPMVGWWLAGLLSLADTDWWLRIPAVILST
ncbi:MAG: glycosyl transferase family 39, partial [Gammaproteobacteria bacterium]|nr:glycosyl transferase family 39 [Gammaproteobacteria bacterium]NIR93577.1 glycosyl transferase family 39 [Gammaproteobacteria bacterium]